MSYCQVINILSNFWRFFLDSNINFSFFVLINLVFLLSLENDRHKAYEDCDKVLFYRILFSSRIKMDQCKQIDFEYDIGMFTKNLATEELLCLQL